MITLVDALIKWKEHSPKQRLYEDKNNIIDYETFYQDCTKLAQVLANKGITKNSKVAIYSDSNLDTLKLTYACWFLKSTVVPLNTSLKKEAILKIIDNIQPTIGIFPETYNKEKIPFPTVSFPKESELEKIKSSIDIEAPQKESPAFILFTSGSSGIPKGVPITHGAIYLNAFQTQKRLSLTQTDKIFINTPAYTTSSLLHFFTSLTAGSSIVVEKNSLFGSDLIDQINAYQCTGFGGVPVHFTRLVSAFKKGKKANSLRFVMNSGDHLSIQLIEELLNQTPNLEIFCVYGLTEVAGRFCILDSSMIRQKKGSVGKPLEGMSITIRNENKESLPSNTQGTIYISGPMLTPGYVNNEEVNKKEFHNGEFCTGDIGYLDDEGFLFIQGRKDDIIKVGGEKVSIKMIEQYIHNYKLFKEFMVIVIEDKHMGNVPGLIYVLNKNQPFNKGDFITYMKKYLPETNIPLRFYEKEALPKTASGKLIRQVEID